MNENILYFLILFNILFFSIRYYDAYRLRVKIVRVIFILQGMVIDDYYDEFFDKNFIKNNDITDDYDKFFGNDIENMLKSVPSIFRIFISLKPIKMENWMDCNFISKYNLFVNDNYNELYKKYLSKALIASIYKELNN